MCRFYGEMNSRIGIFVQEADLAFHKFFTNQQFEISAQMAFITSLYKTSFSYHQIETLNNGFPTI